MNSNLKTLINNSQGVDVNAELKNNKLIIFGASGGGMILKKNLETLGHSINFFCDNDENKWGKNIDDVEVISPVDLKSFDREKYLICIASKWAYEIAVQLKNIGVKY